MLDDRSGLPLYRQLSHLLREKILSGQWKVNEKIPTEPELCEEYGISRMTVRLALEELRKDGFIYRRQGRGTFVALPKIDQRLSSFYSFTDEIKEMGYQIRKEILLWRKETADRYIAEKLQIAETQEIFKIERVLYCNDSPFAAETSHIPVNLCPLLNRMMVETEGLYHSLDRFGIRPNKASEMFEAIIINEKYQKLLQTNGISPGFLVHRISFHDTLPVEFCEGYVSGERVRYNIALH